MASFTVNKNRINIEKIKRIGMIKPYRETLLINNEICLTVKNGVYCISKFTAGFLEANQSDGLVKIRSIK